MLVKVGSDVEDHIFCFAPYKLVATVWKSSVHTLIVSASVHLSLHGSMFLKLHIAEKFGRRKLHDRILARKSLVNLLVVNTDLYANTDLY